MSNTPRRLTDPEVVLDRIEASSKAFGDLTTLVAELGAARGRLSALESSLGKLVSKSERQAKRADEASERLRVKSTEIEALTREAMTSLSQDGERHAARVEELVREAERMLDGQRRDVKAQVEGLASRADVILADVAEERRVLSAELERFRMEQLTKLADISTAHDLLSSRQREAEASEQRQRRELIERIEKLGTEISGQVAEFTQSLSALEEGLRSVVSTQGDEIKVLKTTLEGERSAAHARLQSVERSLRWKIALAAIPGTAALSLVAVQLLS